MRTKTITRNPKLEKQIEQAISDKWQNISQLIPDDNPLAYSRLELTLTGNKKKQAIVFLSKGLGYILLIEDYPYFCVAYWNEWKEKVFAKWELEGTKYFEFRDV